MRSKLLRRVGLQYKEMPRSDQSEIIRMVKRYEVESLSGIKWLSPCAITSLSPER